MLEHVGLVLTAALFAASVLIAAEAWIAIHKEPSPAAEPEPDAVDGVELPNVIPLRVQGGGLRSARARWLELERRQGPGRAQ